MTGWQKKFCRALINFKIQSYSGRGLQKQFSIELLEAAMNAEGCCSIPRELCYWITFLGKALPLRSVGTFVELLIGAMLTPTGFVTDAYLVVRVHYPFFANSVFVEFDYRVIRFGE